MNAYYGLKALRGNVPRTFATHNPFAPASAALLAGMHEEEEQAAAVEKAAARTDLVAVN